jgi:hypothetical protein
MAFDLQSIVHPVSVPSESEILYALKIYTNRENCDQELLAHKLYTLLTSRLAKGNES